MEKIGLNREAELQWISSSHVQSIKLHAVQALLAIYMLDQKSHDTNKHLERAKRLSAIGVVASGLFAGNQIAMLLAENRPIGLEGALFLLPKILVIVGSVTLFLNVRAGILVFAVAALLSVAASIQVALTQELPVGVFAAFHLPAFIFYAAIIWLLVLHCRVMANKSLNSDAGKAGAG